MNFKEFLNESNREVSVEDRKIADDIEKSIKKTLTQKFLDGILHNAIKDNGATLSKFSESSIKLKRLTVVPVGKTAESEGRIFVEIEAIRLGNRMIYGSDINERMLKEIKKQATDELAKVLRKQVSSQVKNIVKVFKKVWGDSILITLVYE